MSLCLFNFYAEYIMQNDGLDDSQAGIKIARRNINNLTYADDTTLMAESKEPLDEGERGEWKSWLKTQHSKNYNHGIRSHQLSLVAQSCLTLCDPTDCSTPGFPIHHQLLQLAQTHVHRVGDAIQPSHPLSSPSPLAFNLAQHQGLFQ